MQTKNSRAPSEAFLKSYLSSPNNWRKMQKNPGWAELSFCGVTFMQYHPTKRLFLAKNDGTIEKSSYKHAIELMRWAWSKADKGGKI